MRTLSRSTARLPTVTQLAGAATALVVAALATPQLAVQANPAVVLGIVLWLEMAVLFLLQAKPTLQAHSMLSWATVLACLLYGFLFDFDEVGTAYQGGMAVVAAGLALAIVAFAVLGRGFGLAPALRRLTTRGPYAIARHPIYASYIIIDIGILIAYPTLYNAAVCAGGWALIGLRIGLEERLLRLDPDYVRYAAVVKWRLIPWLV
jgi:protein-S-isoprenylcysteine O-methyltransferase Ste14